MASARSAVLAALLLAFGAHGLVQDDEKNRPVSKVINLLKDMVVQLEKEGEEDEEVYEQMGCWCTTNEKEKTKAISDEEQRIASLTSDIESLTANSARLNAEIEKLDEEISKNTNALNEATELREKNLKEFNEEEKSNLQTINSLKSAVVALSKHHEGALLQQESSASTINFLTVAADLKTALHRHSDVLKGVFTSKQRAMIASFAQDPQDYIDPQMSLIQSSAGAPASGEIFGMLKQMKETFETNLKNSQIEEGKQSSDYESLKKTKKEQIAAGTDQSETKTQELAMTDEKNAQSKMDLEDTQRSLEADTKFLANLKEKCAGMDAEFEERTTTRQLEIQAVSKALAYLNSDEAHDLFSRNFNFMQTMKHSQHQDQFAKLVKGHKSKALLRLTGKAHSSAAMDAFGAVNKNIQKMIDKLVKEKTDEIALRALCIEELAANEKDIEDKDREKAELEAKIADLEAVIDTLSKEIEVLKRDIAELQVQMKRAGENREKSNKEFQIVVADQKATQKLLGKALEVLKGFYDKMSLSQQSAQQPSFKNYEKNANSGGVMGMIRAIIGDSKAMLAEAVRGEEDTQKAYEDFVKDSNETIEAKTKEVINKEEVKAKREQDKVQAKKALKAVKATLEALWDENADLHKKCDFTLKNFELRQTARNDEIGALEQAIAMFSGASFSAFLQAGDADADSDNDFWYEGNAFARK